MKRFNAKSLIILLLTASIILMPTTCLAETIYDFSDEAQIKFEQQEKKQTKTNVKTNIKTGPQVESAKKNPNKQNSTEKVQEIYGTINKIYYGNTLQIPENTSFTVVLQSTINSASLSDKDIIAASMEEDWVYNGVLIAPSGSIVYGKATDTKKAGLFYGNGEMTIMFDTIILPNGEQVKLVSNAVTVKTKGNRVGKSALNVIGGALVGVVSGVLYALVSGGSVTNGVIYGASVGGAGGLVTAASQKGENVEIPAGTMINIRLTQPMNVNTYRE